MKAKKDSLNSVDKHVEKIGSYDNWKNEVKKVF